MAHVNENFNDIYRNKRTIINDFKSLNQLWVQRLCGAYCATVFRKIFIRMWYLSMHKSCNQRKGTYNIGKLPLIVCFSSMSLFVYLLITCFIFTFFTYRFTGHGNRIISGFPPGHCSDCNCAANVHQKVIYYMLHSTFCIKSSVTLYLFGEILFVLLI